MVLGRVMRRVGELIDPSVVFPGVCRMIVVSANLLKELPRSTV